jgi:hypothetical protein
LIFFSAIWYFLFNFNMVYWSEVILSIKSTVTK